MNGKTPHTTFRFKTNVLQALDELVSFREGERPKNTWFRPITRTSLLSSMILDALQKLNDTERKRLDKEANKAVVAEKKAQQKKKGVKK